MLSKTLKLIYEAGFQAHEQEGSKAENPHPKESEEACYWDHGFRDAQKLTEKRH